MYPNTDKNLILTVQEYDEQLNKSVADGDLFNNHDSDDLIIFKLQKLKIHLELQQRYTIDDCPMIIIRHGLSDGNILESLFPPDQRNDNQVISLYTHKYMKDNPLHRAGELQAIEKSEWLKTIPLEMVLVSPLRRAILTAFHLLKPHPDKGDIEIIVCPHIFTGIYSTGEIITDYLAQKSKFIKLFSKNGMKINYDWADEMASQAPIKDHLQLAISQNQEYKQKYLEEFSTQQSSTQDEQQKIDRRLFIENKMSGILEDGPSFHKRYQHTKSQLRNFFEKRQLYGKKLHKKVLLVAHKDSIRCLTGRGYLGNWRIDGAIDSSYCEAVPLQWENLEIEK